MCVCILFHIYNTITGLCFKNFIKKKKKLDQERNFIIEYML